MVTINSSLNDEQVELICLEYGLKSKTHEVSEANLRKLISGQDDEKDFLKSLVVQ